MIDNGYNHDRVDDDHLEIFFQQNVLMFLSNSNLRGKLFMYSAIYSHAN